MSSREREEEERKKKKVACIPVYQRIGVAAAIMGS
jgi:hypothetical protein